MLVHVRLLSHVAFVTLRERLAVTLTPTRVATAPRGPAAQRHENGGRVLALATQAAPRQRLVRKIRLPHVLGVRCVAAALAQPHRLECIALGNGELTVRRGNADVEGN